MSILGLIHSLRELNNPSFVEDAEEYLLEWPSYSLTVVIRKSEAIAWVHMTQSYDLSYETDYQRNLNDDGGCEILLEHISGILAEGAHCFDCPDQGWYIVPDSNGEPTQEQCEWCYTTKDSKFNKQNET